MTEPSQTAWDALRDIASIDTNPYSPNSAGWRSTLIYAVSVAKMALESEPLARPGAETPIAVRPKAGG